MPVPSRFVATRRAAPPLEIEQLVETAARFSA